MNNLHEFKEFQNRKKTEKVQESAAQLFDDAKGGGAKWKVRTRIEVPVTLINSFVKKVQNETGEDPRKKWSEQEIAESIADYVATSFMTIENLPVSIISNATQEPKVQSQEDMSPQTQVQPPAQDTNTPPAQAPVQNAQQAPVQNAQQPPAQNAAQNIPQSEQNTI